MDKYGKAIVAALFFIWTVVAPLLGGDNAIHGLEWLIAGTGLANALLVYIVPLNPRWEAGKTVINGVLASLAAAQTVLLDGFQADDLTIIIGAGLTIIIGWYAPTLSMARTAEQVAIPSGFNA